MILGESGPFLSLFTIPSWELHDPLASSLLEPGQTTKMCLIELNFVSTFPDRFEESHLS